MSNWIKEAAQKMQEEKERRQKVAAHEEALNKALAASRPVALQKLREAVEKDVALFNQEFPDPQKRLKNVEDIGNNGFQVLRQYAPFYTLQVILEGSEIRYQVLATGKDKGTFGIELANGEVRIRKGNSAISFEDASKELVLPALSGLAE